MLLPRSFTYKNLVHRVNLYIYSFIYAHTGRVLTYQMVCGVLASLCQKGCDESSNSTRREARSKIIN